jgi:hypothetical protein
LAAAAIASGLDATLHAGAANRGDSRIAAREVAGRERGGGAGAVDGDLDRIHQRQRPAVGRIGEVDHALHRRQAVGGGIAGIVAVELDRHHRRIARQQRRGLGVVRAARHMEGRGGRGERLAGGRRPKAGFDRVDIVGEIHQAGDLGARQDQHHGSIR